MKEVGHSSVASRFSERVRSLRGATLCERKRIRAKWAALLVIALSFGLVILFTSRPLVEPAALAQGPQYVGSDRCALCHRDIFDA